MSTDVNSDSLLHNFQQSGTSQHPVNANELCTKHSRDHADLADVSHVGGGEIREPNLLITNKQTDKHT